MGCGASRTAEQQPLAAALGVSASLTNGKPSASSASRHSSKTKIDDTDLSGTAMVKAWAADADGTLCFPELDDPEFAIPALVSNKLPLAICISGGGFRAATLCLGWLRALHILGILGKAKYMCSCSGATWLTSALSFQQKVPLDDFLGPYLPPEQCVPEALSNVGEKDRSAAAVLSDAEPLRQYFRELGAGLLDGDGEEGLAKQARSWSKAMAGAFLQPFGLGDTDHSTVTANGTKAGVEASVAERAAAMGRGNVFAADLKALPFPIISQVFLLAKERCKYFPLEWTPLYSGCPVKCSETSPKLGAGYVETLGINANLVGQPEPVAECPATGTAVRVRVRPAGPASLGEAIGISSAYNAYSWALGKSKVGKAMHVALGFNTAQYFNQQDWKNHHVELADGCGVDYYALYPVLRRKVPAVIVCSATRTAVDHPKFSFYMKELAGLFGCWPGDPKADLDKDLTADEYNKLQQVFAPEGFTAMIQALKGTAAAGLSPVHVDEYDVLDNVAMGIRGGWRVRVMWVINDRQSQWEAALPQETREELETDRTTMRAKVEEALNPLDADTLREFPHVSTFAMDYTPQLVNLMSNHAAHMLMSNKAALQGMLAVAEEEAA